MRLRPTRRGTGLLVLGAAVATTGTALGSTDLLTLGTLPVLLVLLGLLGVGLVDPGRGRGLRTRRTVRPDPVHAGRSADVHVEVALTRGASRARLADLRLREQAAVELSGGRPLRATVSREPRAVRLRYPVQATRRGRWALGPLVVTRTDPFGVAQVRATLGERETLTVWPAVADLPAPRELLVAEPERSVVGARSPAADDAALRDYRVGDDLRRVHWPSSARRGELVVRSDERAGMRPVTVLLDQPPAGEDLEWSISLAASVALAMHGAGHPTHLLTGTAVDDPRATRVEAPGRQQLLEATVDLTGHDTAAAARDALLAEIRGLDETDGGSGLVVAVLGPQGTDGRAALAGVSQTRPGWAVVRGTEDPAADATATALRRAGWRVVQADPGDDLAGTWWRLTGGAA
ncbi:DUF58 domain-containing protein [Cellulomonas triticagri]|uniref:DUF58 domain-containing protein n=1 Tax=Cellulomonas triticagri TaxID=2483352 RepID=A0A3M2J925_9CELL|nr:DUF58 domain-containing protein [Cellulomonas triticagri]RMI08636.1 DUF58 domain-containing protein [Cellulomonas triticagri]